MKEWTLVSFNSQFSAHLNLDRLIEKKFDLYQIQRVRKSLVPTLEKNFSDYFFYYWPLYKGAEAGLLTVSRIEAEEIEGLYSSERVFKNENQSNAILKVKINGIDFYNTLPCFPDPEEGLIFENTLQYLCTLFKRVGKKSVITGDWHEHLDECFDSIFSKGFRICNTKNNFKYDDNNLYKLTKLVTDMSCNVEEIVTSLEGSDMLHFPILFKVGF